MEGKTEFEIVIYAADKVFYEGTCLSIIVPIQGMQYGILAHHKNLISAVVPGIISAKLADGRRVYAAVSNGLLKIEEGKVMLLVYTCETLDEIDENRARQAEEDAKRKLREKLSRREFFLAQASLARALNRMKASQKQKRN